MCILAILAITLPLPSTPVANSIHQDRHFWSTRPPLSPLSSRHHLTPFWPTSTPLRLLGGSKQSTRQTPSSKMALLTFAMPILLLFPVVLLAPKLKPRHDFHQRQQYRTYISSRIGSTYAPFPTATIGVVSSTP